MHVYYMIILLDLIYIYTCIPQFTNNCHFFSFTKKNLAFCFKKTNIRPTLNIKIKLILKNIIKKFFDIFGTKAIALVPKMVKNFFS